MKFSTRLLTALTCAATARGSDHRLLASSGGEWNLIEPVLAIDGTNFNITFPVMDFITTGMIKYSTWTAPDCQSDNGVSLDGSSAWDTPPALVENQALAEGRSQDSGSFAEKNATIVMNFDPENISTSIIYTDTSSDGQASAAIRFCIHVGLWSTNETTPVELNFAEELLTVIVDLNDGFQIDSVEFETKESLETTVDVGYTVLAYECTADNFTELTDTQKAQPHSEGDIITICVTLDTEALADGIFMQAINYFTFTRDANDSEVQQVAIENDQQADNMTTYNAQDCIGSTVCLFSTRLHSDFYTTSGTVSGIGVGSFQFGDSKASVRRLRAERQRELQAAISAGCAEVDLFFEVTGTNRTAQTASGAGSTSIGTAMTILTAVMAMAPFL